MWFLPSRGRPHLIDRVFLFAPPSQDGVLAIDEDQRELYADVVLPHKGWSIVVLPRMFLGPKLNCLVEIFPHQPFYGILNDDMVPQTPGWDVILSGAAGRGLVAWGDDGLHRRIGAAAFGGDVVRALGWLACPALNHFYIDDAHETVVRDLGIGVPRMDISVPHLHFSMGGTPMDATYRGRPPVDADRRNFEYWRDHVWPIQREGLKTKRAA